ncbi:MAG TPA: hypothetical protein VM328_08965 [Fimbriimonadaceae bacterium]|nr:hypothetical protein [Fimbriimonadaceae bacterium]
MVALYALAILPQALPQSPWTGYSGMPTLSAGSSVVQTVSHSVTAEVDDTHANVTTVTVFKNLTAQEIRANLDVPKGTLAGADNDGEAKFDIDVRWDDKPAGLRSAGATLRIERRSGPFGPAYSRASSGEVVLKPSATHSVKTSYKVPVGKAGFDRKQRLVAYLLQGEEPVGTLNVTFRYRGKTVFNLPQMHPKEWPWQVGERGAFIRHREFAPGNTLVYLTYYPGGFQRIGG